jgi:peptidoglycan DL-endopeptidase CwlO
LALPRSHTPGSVFAGVHPVRFLDRASKHAGWVFAAVLLIFGSASLFAADPVRKPAAKEPASAAPKKKAGPKPASKPASDEPAEVASKTKAASSTPSPKAKKPDREPEPENPPRSVTAPNVTIAPEELVEFNAQPAAVKKLIESSLALAGQNLTYTYGSSDPATGGLDCSGFIYHVLRHHGFTQVPRNSSGQYTWVRRARGFRSVISRKADSFELDELLPGDLLFWTGTYATPNDPPISHVMLYLGTEKLTGIKVMVGSSDGRTYHGQKRNGASVFDFLMPRAPISGDQRTAFIGYGRIPGLRD